MLFITGNHDKFLEAQALIPDLQKVELDLPEIQSLDPREIIGAKLEAAAAEGYTDFFVEDTGLYLSELNDFPGPLIKWLLKSVGNSGIASLLENKNTAARAITWIGYHDSAATNHFFEGICEGEIVTPRGESFGWDPIFQPLGLSQTFAEMSKDVKNSISMRRKAIEKLVEYTR